ncbi:MAG: DUF4349 domain-containing protein [Anaerolineae bacterium]|nr:MAG: DUF4349 domain-containing protein [Anaerolineae bacterium]
MKTPKTLTLFIVAALLLAGCGAKAAVVEPTEAEYRGVEVYADTTAPSDAVGEAPSVGLAAEPSAEYQLTGSGSGEYAAANSVPVAGERLVLKSADLSVVVTDPIAQMDAIIRMAEGMGGFVVTSNLYEVQTYEGQTVKNATLTIRVPSAQFGTALGRLEGDALEVQHKNISGQDVTQSYTDLQSRLRNLENAAEQLRAIMADAYKTDEVLMVYYQLVQVTEQIEVLKGQIAYYEEAASFSSISVNLISAASLVEPEITIAGWSPQGVARDAAQQLLEVLRDVATAGIWLAVYVLPQVLMFGLPLLLVVRWLRRLLNGSKPVAAAASGD